MYFADNDDVGVLTIGDNPSRPIGKGKVPIVINDNSGIQRKLVLEDILYFPQSPVNILGVTALASQFEDSHGTWILTRWKSSTFTWNHGKFVCDFEVASF